MPAGVSGGAKSSGREVPTQIPFSIADACAVSKNRVVLVITTPLIVVPTTDASVMAAVETV